jgi:hypothetical protein
MDHSISLDGAELLTDVRDWLGRFIITTTEGDLDLLALWCAHTHLVREVYTTPRLQIDSPVPECGKTTVLEHLQRLCVRPVLMAVASSPALLTRMLEVEIRTLLIDEADRSLNKDKPGVEDLFAVLNSGYKRGGTRPVLVQDNGQWVAREMSTFAPVALAGNQPALPDDTKSRIIRVLLLPDYQGSAEESNWELLEPEAAKLHNRLVTWAHEVRDQVRTSQPTMPAGIIARFREKWQPLRKVADAAGGRWPGIVDDLALLDKAEHDADKEAGLITEKPGAVLLKHLHELWPADVAFWHTLPLVDILVTKYPSMWGEESSYGKRLTPQRLGWMLVTNYKVHSSRETRSTPRGYYRTHFAKAWQSMGLAPVEPVEPEAPVHREGSKEPDHNPEECSNSNCRAFGACVEVSNDDK